MPYDSNDALPDPVKRVLPSDKARSLWRRVFNDSIKRGYQEGRSFGAAYAAIDAAGFKKDPKTGVYTEKAIQKALYQGREVEVDKPFRLPQGSSKKFGVYVTDGDKIKKVTFGDPNMEIRRDDPAARANFRARHSCDTATDKTSARYWSCRMWESGTSVSEMTKMNEIQKTGVPPLDEATNTEILNRMVEFWNLGPQVASSDPTANPEYWANMAAIWAVDVPEARRHLCANCEYFDDTPQAMQQMDAVPFGPLDADGGGRGYCHKFDFICHNLRTCQAWEEREFWSDEIKPMETAVIGKRQISEDVFTTAIEAVQRAQQLGLGMSVHITQAPDGQAFYMPGVTHDAYLELVQRNGMIASDGAAVDNPTADLIESVVGTAIEAIMSATMEKRTAKIIKLDQEARIVWGWASVVSVDGKPMVDRQGDIISADVMTKAADRFMLDVRVAKAMHEGAQIGEVIHSFPLTKALGEALGVHSALEGWIVAMKVHDDSVWNRVKSGELAAFSIGGIGKRNAV